MRGGVPKEVWSSRAIIAAACGAFLLALAAVLWRAGTPAGSATAGTAGLAALAFAAWARFREHGAVKREGIRFEGFVTDADAHDLGADLEVPSEELGGHPWQYVARDADEEVRTALREALLGTGPSIVVVHGRTKVGKTRLLFEATQRELRKCRLVAPADVAGLRSRMAGSTQADSAPVVFWLDDLEDFVQVDGGVSLSDLQDTVKRGAIVVATAGGRGAVRRSSDEQRQFTDRLSDILYAEGTAVRRCQLPEVLSASEIQASEAAFGAKVGVEIGRIGIAEYMVAAPRLCDKLVTGLPFTEGRACVEGQDIVWAATAWRRTGLMRPIPADVLRQLTSLSESELDAAVKWATEPVVARSRLLTPSGDSYQPHDVVVQFAREQQQPLSAEVWRIATEGASADECNSIGLAAVRSGHLGEAERAFKRGDTLGHGRASYHLGVFLQKERDDLTAAEMAYRRADERGDAPAAFNLGNLLRDRDDFEEAEAAYGRAEARGHLSAINNLGTLLQNRGDLDGAEAAFRRADERGHQNATYNLGVFLRRERGELEGAEEAFRRAGEQGHLSAMNNLGGVLLECGDLDGAEAAYRRADERGHAPATFNLGILLQRERADPAGAETAFRRAEERGDVRAVNALGTLLRDRGDLAGAEAAFRRADERGHMNATYNLGVLLWRERGEFDAAIEAFRRADAGGHAEAAASLGDLLWAKRSAISEAENAFRRADDRGSSVGARRLGVLLIEERDDPGGGLAALNRADERGDGAAAYLLGVLLEAGGERAAAEAAFQRAAERGHTAQMHGGGDDEPNGGAGAGEPDT